MGTQPVSINRQADAWTYAAASSAIVNTATARTIKAAVGVGVRNYVTDLQINTAILGAATELAIRDGTGATMPWRCQLQTGVLPIMSANFQSPHTLLEMVALTAVTGGVFVNAPGYAGS
jgi:hypothetical protein